MGSVNTKPFRVGLLLACLAATPQITKAQIQIEQVSGQAVVASEVLVRLKPGISVSQLSAALDASAILPAGNSGWLRVRSRSIAAGALINAAALSPLVAEAHPNYVIQLNETVPSDSDFANLWNLRNTGQTINGKVGFAGADVAATRAWDITLGSRANLVGIVDTGIDYRHPDLVDNVWSAPAPYTITLGSSTYTCPSGSHGFNAVGLNCDPLDDNNHGTHVAGIVGARGNNALGVTGVNWKTSLIALKVLNLFGTASMADAINGIEAAIQLKAQGYNVRVLNASWSTNSVIPPLEQVIAAANTAGILFVAGAGNNAASNDGANPTFPATFAQPNIISVAATDNRDQLASFSSYGPTTVHLGAPGQDVLSTFIGAKYFTLSGTSMAAPHVTGAAALVLSRCALDTAALKQTLLASADPVPGLAGVTITGARLNVHRALQQCGATPTPDFELSISQAALSVAPGTTAQLTVNVQQFFGLTGAVNLSVSGLPPGVTPLFSPSMLAGSASSTLSLAVDPAAAQGTYPLLLKGVDAQSGVVNTVALSLSIFAPDFALAGPSSGQLTSATPLTLPLAVVTVGGFAGNVQLTATGLPAGLTANFAPSTVAAPGTATLILTANSLTPLGNFTVNVQGASGSLIRNLPLALTIAAAPDLALTLGSSQLTAAPGGPVSTILQVDPVAKFSGTVTFAALGMPAGFTAAFSPSTVTTVGSTLVTLSAPANAALGSYPIILQATSGALVRSVNLTLNVIALPSLSVTLPATLEPGSSAVVQVALPSPAPLGGLDIALTNSNPAAASLSLTSLYVPAGQTSSTRARLTGLSAGAVTIAALSSGLGPGSASVQVGSTVGALKFVPSSLTLTPSSIQNLTLSLAPPAPPAGLLLSLSSSNPAAATVPATFAVPGNAASVAIPIAALANGTATLTASGPNYTQATAALTVASATPSALTITTSTLPTGQAGQLFSQLLSATGGTKPYTWLLNSGTLPSGLTLNPATGLLSGVPLASASAALTFRVTDSSPTVQTASVTLPLTILATSTVSKAIGLPASLILNPGSDSSLIIQLFTPAPTGGVLLNLTNGSPAIVSLNTTALFIPAGQSSSSKARVTGLTSGVAQITVSGDGYGAAAVNVQVGGSTGALSLSPSTLALTAPSTQNLTLTLSPPAPSTGLTVTLSSTNPAALTVPLTLSVPGNAATLAVPVTAVAPGQATITVAAANYAPATATITAAGAPAALTLTTNSLGSGTVGQLFSLSLAATGGTKPYSWTVAGALPAGLTLNSVSGLLSGIPQATASVMLQLRVTDASTPAQSATVTLPLTINAAQSIGPSITLTPLATLLPGQDAALIIRLSTPAPAGGLDLALISNDPSIASLNLTSLYIPAGQTSSSRVRVLAKAAGVAGLTVTAPGYLSATLPVQVGAGPI